MGANASHCIRNIKIEKVRNRYERYFIDKLQSKLEWKLRGKSSNFDVRGRKWQARRFNKKILQINNSNTSHKENTSKF